MEGSIVRKVVECVRLYEEEVGVLFPIVQALKEAFKPESVVWHWSEGEMYIKEREIGCFRLYFTNK